MVTGVGWRRLSSAGPTKKELLALADWLRCLQVPAGVLEAANWNGPMVRSPLCGSYRTI